VAQDTLFRGHINLSTSNGRQMSRSTLLCAALLCLGRAVDYDIHVRFDSRTERLVKDYNAFVSSNVLHNAVNLSGNAVPHATLYSASFVDIPDIAEQITGLVNKVVQEQQEPCSFALDNLKVHGSFGMWMEGEGPPATSRCMQRLSDEVVEAVKHLRNSSAPMPSWIRSMPLRQKLPFMFLWYRYGSPFVKFQFQPHTTLAWDGDTTDDLAQVFASKSLPRRTVHPVEVAISEEGPHGIVVRNTAVAHFSLPQAREQIVV